MELLQNKSKKSVRIIDSRYGESNMEDNRNFKLYTPVVFCTFNRLDTTKRVFEKIKEASPPKLYLISDCARISKPGEDDKVAAVRAYIEASVDWPCEIRKNYAQENMGCGRRISSGLSWVFEQEEQAIILEDDCVPDPTFFRYCQEMLEYYKDDDRIMMISGNNPMSGCYRVKGEYFFSKVPFVWGWATWKRAWDLYDFDLKSWPTARKDPKWHKVFPLRAYWVYMSEFDALYRHTFNIWGYQLMYAIIYQDKLAVAPSDSHVFNIGFDEEATNTKKGFKWIRQDIVPVRFPIAHIHTVEWNRDFDRFYMKKLNKHGIIVKMKDILGIDINRSIFEWMKRK